jgi:hypothetical protein
MHHVSSKNLSQTKRYPISIKTAVAIAVAITNRVLVVVTKAP